MSLYLSTPLSSSWSLCSQPEVVNTEPRLTLGNLCCFLARENNHKDAGAK